MQLSLKIVVSVLLCDDAEFSDRLLQMSSVKKKEQRERDNKHCCVFTTVELMKYNVWGTLVDTFCFFNQNNLCSQERLQLTKDNVFIPYIKM